MSTSPPSLQEWKELFQAAGEFKTIECWKWMYDSDLFGVQDPETGEIGYCCVLGNLGEVFGLTMYLGTEGLQVIQKMQSGEVGPEDMNILFIQRCLTASFDDRDALEKEDHEVIKRLGLKFRGRGAWPNFRSYLPNYVPWFVNSAEARFLTLALQQAKDVALRFKADRKYLKPAKNLKNHHLVRVPTKTETGIEWNDEWLLPKPTQEINQTSLPVLDQLRLERIKKSTPRQSVTFEVDFFQIPAAIKDADRPYYPFLFLMVDHNSGFALQPNMSSPDEHLAKFQEGLLQFFESYQMIPSEILVQQAEVFHLLEPITQKLGIKLAQVKRLKMMEHVQAAMFQSLF